jgi:uncharacterized membrane protein
MIRIKKIIHALFLVSLIIKAINGLLEFCGGAILFFIKPSQIKIFVTSFFGRELSEDPRDLIANYLTNAANHLSVSFQLFAAYYLLIHGGVKILLIIGLFKRKIWVYPIALIFFTAFVVYQLYRYSYEPAAWLIYLSILDIIVIGLTWWEYRRLKTKHPRFI